MGGKVANKNTFLYEAEPQKREAGAQGFRVESLNASIFHHSAAYD